MEQALLALHLVHAQGGAPGFCAHAAWVTLLPPAAQAPGIVVDGVVASPLARWGTVYGHPHLPPAVDHRLPAIQQALLTPAYWAYRMLGPRLVWRINQHPLFGAWNAL